jgi:glycosyltransferase involved in cell wall biosynthesis
MSSRVKRRSGLHVFMTADTVGGVWQYALDLASGLHARDVKITLVTLGPAPATDQRVMAESIGIELLPTSLPLDWTAGTRDEVEHAGRCIAGMVEELSPDLVHLNSPALAASAVFSAPIVAVCHSCIATWWRATRSGPLPSDFAWREQMVRRGYKASDILLAPTAAFANMTAETYDLETAPLVVRNGRRITQIHEASPFGLFAFTAGRLWDEGKNIAALDRAAARLALPVLAAGPLHGPNGASIDIHHVIALGRISDQEIAGRLNGLPIFVSVARYEPFGLAVLEAAQAGCPLVLSNIPTFRELWDGAAIFVSPDDDEEIANAIMYLAHDASARTELGHAAKERAAIYSVDAMCAAVLGVYRSLTTAKPRISSSKRVAA